MQPETTSKIRQTPEAIVVERGDRSPLAEQNSLVSSNRLGSLTATQFMMKRQELGLDLADAEFDIIRLKTFAGLEFEARGGGSPRSA